MKDHQTADRVLADALRVIANEDARTSASPGVEARVMAAFDAAAMARRRRARVVVAALGAAAALVGAVAIFKSEVGSLKSDRKPRQTSDFRLQTSSSQVATAFMPLVYNGVPIVDGHVVRMEVPRASLISFGLLPVDSADSAQGTSSGTVLADVIVGDDGLARAVRFVRRSGRKEQQR